MRRIWQKEALPVLLALFALLPLEGISGSWLAATALVCVAYIGWMYYRVSKLERWVARGMKTSEVHDDHGIFADIIRALYRQRKQHSKRKKKTKELLHKLKRNISALPDATIVLNDQLEIEWSNAQAEYLLGINPRHDIGMRISNLVRDPDFLRYLISPGTRGPLELQSPIDQNATLQIKIIRFGSDQRMLIARDVSDMKHLQDGLKNFVANASHELKTPLTTIAGHLEMLELDPALSEAGKNSVQVAQKQASRMRDLILDLLLLSQVEAYQLQPDEGDYLAIPEIMSNCMAAVDRDCAHPSVTCKFPEKLALLGIKSEVEGICINLVENAFKYSPDETSQVLIEWNRNDKFELVFSVTDHGMGIDARELKHITERYFRGEQAHARQIVGSGLGLAIVKQAAAKHGARLEIDSQSGSGSRFTVVFPSYRTLKKSPQAGNVVRLAAS